MNKNSLVTIAGLTLIFGLFFIFKPATQNSSTNSSSSAQIKSPTKIFDLTINNKKLTNGSSKIQVTEGDDVVIRVTSDIDGEFHLHGYDKSVDLLAGKTVDLVLTANLTGSFPFELETTKTDLGSLEVSPK